VTKSISKGTLKSEPSNLQICKSANPTSADTSMLRLNL